MDLLFDTHILIGLLEQRTADFPPHVRHSIHHPPGKAYVSVATLWEIAIKVRLGKLSISARLDELPNLVEDIGIDLLPIEPAHVIAELDPLPPTRDPFDRLLLAQCQVEDMRLLTIDRALVGHPVAVKPAS